ncbi:6-phosphogluconolactonase [Cupriavidus basilensis OR16]|uniref:6-phosphogluconolactonase n=1 Tax=Cupriavidus basilensis OR16 TaxID=1127483 RepID=H1S7Z2_9BURK|nr:6-phosphogluconolactonase [Cupriavidus basilensis]EHP41391.1 6-phosphogluconolactonase [Cupriavidus basilensis OR16]
MQQIFHDNVSAQAAALALSVAGHLSALIKSKGSAYLAVSGGRTPVPFFQALSMQRLPWQHVAIMLVDERAVPPHHTDSNARLVAANLLRGEATRARFIPLVTEECATQDRIDVAKVLTQANTGFSQPDVVVLGMGEDGHIASLFADAPEYAQAMNLSAPPGYTATSPRSAAHRRITLNRAALLGASKLILAIGGASKREVFTLASHTQNVALPVSCIIHQDTVPIDVYAAN